jgi:hypothetical protein
MATYVDTASNMLVGQLDLTGLCEQYAFGDLSIAAVGFTTYADRGWVANKPGLKSGTFTATLFQDFAADVLDDDLGVAALGGTYAVTVVPDDPTPAAGDLAWFSRGYLGRYNPLTGTVGDAAKAEIELPYDRPFVQGKLLHPKTARTANGNGTAVAMTGPTASQRLYAALHVTAYSGFTNVVVKVQSDDAAGMSTPTDRVTFSTVTGVGSEYTSVAGGFSTESHVRSTWTVTGSGSISFVVVCGVL